jgi:hypothetical protein
MDGRAPDVDGRPRRIADTAPEMAACRLAL